MPYNQNNSCITVYSHYNLVLLMRWIGLDAPDFICYGYMAANIPALFLRDYKRANDRIDLMFIIFSLKSNSKSFATNLIELIRILPAEKREIACEIEAFCQAIYFHYMPELHEDWFAPKTAPRQYDYLKTLSLLMPKALEEKIDLIDGQLSIATSEWSIIAFNLTDLIHFLNYLRAASEAIASPILIELHSITHSIVITYDKGIAKWITADAQSVLLSDCVYDMEQAYLILNSFSQEGLDIVLSLRYLALLRKHLEDFLSILSNNSFFRVLNNITLQTAQRRGYFYEHILHVAAQVGNLSLVKAIDEMDPALKDTLSSDSSPLKEAVTMGHVGVIHYLIERVNQTKLENSLGDLLKAAVEANQLGSVAILMQHMPDLGAQLDAVELACKLGFNDILLFLLGKSLLATELAYFLPGNIKLYLHYFINNSVNEHIALHLPQRNIALKKLLILAWEKASSFAGVVENIHKIDRIYFNVSSTEATLQAILPTLSSAYLQVSQGENFPLLGRINSLLAVPSVSQHSLFRSPAIKRQVPSRHDDADHTLVSVKNRVKQNHYHLRARICANKRAKVRIPNTYKIN